MRWRTAVYLSRPPLSGPCPASREIEELADVLEVVAALRDQAGVSAEELAEIRAEKAAERGRFEERIVLGTVHET